MILGSGPAILTQIPVPAHTTLRRPSQHSKAVKFSGKKNPNAVKLKSNTKNILRTICENYDLKSTQTSRPLNKRSRLLLQLRSNFEFNCLVFADNLNLRCYIGLHSLECVNIIIDIFNRHLIKFDDHIPWLKACKFCR